MSVAPFLDELEEFAAADSLAGLTALLEKHASRLGFQHFVYALEVPGGPPNGRLALVNGYPEAWLEHYFQQGFFASDPVLHYARGHVLPIEWDALGPKALANRVMCEASDFGLRLGVSAPIHGPRAELGVLSFATADSLGRERTRAALPLTQLLAGYVHEALGRVLRREEVNLPRPLTPRERECLLWVAEGKTSWEIGLILGTSERTVNFHLTNAASKLGVSSRQHAVAKALLLGLLRGPPPVRFDR